MSFFGKAYRPYNSHRFDDWDPFYEYRYGGGTVVPHHSTAFTNCGGNLISAPFVMSSTVEWKETPEGHVLKAHLPGMKKEEVKIELEEGNIICITGEKNFEKEEKADHFYRVERSTGRFVKRFQLPEKVEAETMKARMENGVLTVTVPKREKMISNSKTIHIF